MKTKLVLLDERCDLQLRSASTAALFERLLTTTATRSFLKDERLDQLDPVLRYGMIQGNGDGERQTSTN